MDWYWWVLIWGVGWGGWASGALQAGRRALRTRHERKIELMEAQGAKQRAIEAANQPPQPVCGCTHHLAKHDKQGKCHEEVEAPTEWDAEKRPVRYEARRCNCQQYVGPRPLETLYAEDIVPMD